MSDDPEPEPEPEPETTMIPPPEIPAVPLPTAAPSTTEENIETTMSPPSLVPGTETVDHSEAAPPATNIATTTRTTTTTTTTTTEPTASPNGTETAAAAAAAATTTTAATSTAAPTGGGGGGGEDSTSSIGNSMGAKLLRNRFQSLKERANQNAQTLLKSPALQTNAKAMQETASTFWKQAAPKLPPVTSFRRPSFSTIGSKSGPASTTTDPNDGEGTPSNKAIPSEDPQTSAPEGNSDSKSPTVGETLTTMEVESTAAPPSTDESSQVTGDGMEIKPRQFSLSENEEKEDEDEAENEENGNNHHTDQESTTDATSRLRVGVALSRASVAASVAYESASVLATGFRGRYNTNTPTSSNTDRKKEHQDHKGEPTNEDDDPLADSRRPLPESQTEVILKSRVGQHMQSILDQLEDYEYAMLLGKGMLGVNLKQCYLKNHGIFVDFLVPGGQAEASGVVHSGDLPVRLGEVDLRKGTILEVPQAISQTRRPVVLVLATGTKVSLERMNYIDVAVAMMHRARDYYHKRGTLSNLPSASSSSSPIKGGGSGGVATAGMADIQSVTEVTVPAADTIDCFLTPPAPTLDIRREFLDEVPLRCFDNFLVEGLSQVHDMDKNFREAVRNAFLTCALDSRRLPFLSRHFSDEEELPENEGKMSPSAQLMLFLELTSFLDLYDVTSVSRLRDLASRVAYKFFLPTKLGIKGIQPPLFDFHHIVPDASLRHLELVLNGKSQSIPRDLFFDFSKAVVDSLTGPPFISFLASCECAKMRGYLRNTAPYINLPLREVLDALVGETKHAGAKNCFAYILLYLICQLEKESPGEYNFGKEEESNRLLGASNDLCCVVFIKRTFLPALQSAKTAMEKLSPDQSLDKAVTERVVRVCEMFWDVYLAGTLELSSQSNDIETSYKAVRIELERVVSVVTNGGTRELTMDRVMVESFCTSKLMEYASTLADESLFHYAASANSKFREHKFHEWMCNEHCKVRANDPNWNSNHEIPHLPPGCVKRLLRKAELPEGVSSHKPFKSPPQEPDERNYPNADLAVVFGSCVGTDLVSQMPIPGIESTDIRRYTCLPVSLDRELQDMDGFSADEAIPPTFESYAIVNPERSKPFTKATHDSKISKDGWEVSLVSFTIPNADSSRADSALYGVSLFLQCKPGEASIVQNRIDAFVHQEGEANGSEKADVAPKGFQSPISLIKTEVSDPEGTVSDSDKKGFVKNVSVSTPLSAFNEKLKGNSWVNRVMEEEYRDQLQPISIGLALVSRKNVILAMRDALSRLLFDFSRDVNGSGSSGLANVGALVDVLGNFSYKEVEQVSLRCILEPYLRAASAPWIERPLISQAEAFESLALQQINDCLPPIPLALLFITGLLEQKIILSSSRRSVLHSATVALSALLRPLKWSHLMVPMVPATLAGDLIQYPAPFILGIPSEAAENAELIGNLPRDVTLVDLDVGRVILAPDFGQDNDMVQKSEDSTATAKALRTQVLYLAQALGVIFGNSLKPESWLCDIATPPETNAADATSKFESLKASAHGFISELLEGIAPCCYWIEEAAQTYGTTVEPTVLFDEDKFFEIKNHRAHQAHKHLFPREMQGEFALSLDNFDLVLESFLRCQSMSTYISSRPKTDMVYY